MDGGPFAFDNSQPTILTRDDLEKIFKRSGGRKEKKTEGKDGKE